MVLSPRSRSIVKALAYGPPIDPAPKTPRLPSPAHPAADRYAPTGGVNDRIASDILPRGRLSPLDRPRAGPCPPLDRPNARAASYDLPPLGRDSYNDRKPSYDLPPLGRDSYNDRKPSYDLTPLGRDNYNARTSSFDRSYDLELRVTRDSPFDKKGPARANETRAIDVHFLEGGGISWCIRSHEIGCVCRQCDDLKARLDIHDRGGGGRGLGGGSPDRFGALASPMAGSYGSGDYGRGSAGYGNAPKSRFEDRYGR
ncbi:hypothetical protein Q7P37_003869 [Cladosporium fusiforme]